MIEQGQHSWHVDVLELIVDVEVDRRTVEDRDPCEWRLRLVAVPVEDFSLIAQGVLDLGGLRYFCF